MAILTKSTFHTLNLDLIHNYLAVNMESHRRCTRNVRLLHVADMKGNFPRPISSKEHCKPNDEMKSGIFPSTLRTSHAFICAEVLMGRKIVGGHVWGIHECRMPFDFAYKCFWYICNKPTHLVVAT